MTIDKQSGKLAFACDVCGARFELDDKTGSPPDVNALWAAAKEKGWHARQQRGGKWHTACPEIARSRCCAGR